MNPLSLILGLPTLPLRGVIRLGQMIQQQAERELHDPASARRQLEATEAERAEGRASESDEARAEQQVLNRMITRRGNGGQAIEARHQEREG